MENLVLVAQVLSPHGLKGAFKLRSFTQEPIQTYSPLLTNKGEPFSFTIIQDLQSGLYLATSKRIQSRTDAETIKGLQLFIQKNQLPQTQDDEFYHIDLEGCTVFVNDQPYGLVTAVHDFGAGTFLDVQVDKKTATIPFHQEAIIAVDLDLKKISANPDFIFI